jgi:hypothetical protein
VPHHMNDWSRSIGDKRRQRDDAESVAALALLEGEMERRRVSLVRWPRIVAAMRALIARYNEGVGREALVLAEDLNAERPGVTVDSAGLRRSTLAVALEDSELCVGTRAGDAGLVDSRRIDLTRTDDATAEYVVRNWMERI